MEEQAGPTTAHFYRNGVSHMPEPPPPAPGTLFQRQVLHVAALVERGRWSDFGAVSTVIFGDRLRARAIGAAVRKFGVRPEGSRLLHSDGSVPGNYLREATSEAGDDQRGAPEILQARLE